MAKIEDLSPEQREAMRFFAKDLLIKEKPITVVDPENTHLTIGGMMLDILQETRRESFEAVKQDAAARRRVILEILTEKGGMTAREVSAELFRRGITPTDERNFAAPRLTELKEAGKIVVVGKKQCAHSGRNVAVWAVRR